MEEAYAAADSGISQWRRDVTQSAGHDMQRYLQELGRERAHLADLRADLTGVSSLVEGATQLRHDGEQLAQAFHTSVGLADERAQAVARARDELISQRDAHHEALKHEIQELEGQRRAAEERRIEAEKLLSAYHDRLGLAISHQGPKTVRMAFSLIQKAAPEQEFAFTLSLTEVDGCFNVSDCVPMVPEFNDLLAELKLNSTRSSALPRFVCSMRRAFVRWTSSGQEKA